VIHFDFGDTSTYAFDSSVDRVLKRHPELGRFVTTASPMRAFQGRGRNTQSGTRSGGRRSSRTWRLWLRIWIGALFLRSRRRWVRHRNGINRKVDSGNVACPPTHQPRSDKPDVACCRSKTTLSERVRSSNSWITATPEVGGCWPTYRY